MKKCRICEQTDIEFEFQVCKVCGWEDDDIQYENPDYIGGANDMSYNLYKKFFEENKNVLIKNNNALKAIDLANNYFKAHYPVLYRDISKYRTGEIDQEIK